MAATPHKLRLETKIINPPTIYELQGNVDKVIARLAQFRAENLVGNPEIRFTAISDYYDGYDSEVEYSNWRDETDEEFEERVRKERAVNRERNKKAKATRLANERAEYERLKAKFEKET